MLLTADMFLSEEDVERIHGKRWDVEVFFKMEKQHINLTKKINSRDSDTLIAPKTIIFMRYMFLANECRTGTNRSSF